MTARITKIQKDWPAEVRRAPALTLRLGLSRAIAYLHALGPQDLWALQWAAILSLMYAMLLRPSEIIPLDKFSSGRGHDVRLRVPPSGGLLLQGHRRALPRPSEQKTGNVVDYRTCTAAARDIAGAALNAPRALKAYLKAAGLWGAPPHTPVFCYRARSGAPTTRKSRGALLHELRSLILAPSGVPRCCTFTLRSLRPGGATDLAAASVPRASSASSASGRQWQASSHTTVSTITCCRTCRITSSPFCRCSNDPRHRRGSRYTLLSCSVHLLLCNLEGR